MTLEEMLKRKAELEAENKILKTQIDILTLVEQVTENE